LNAQPLTTIQQKCGSPLIELRSGRGLLIGCEMMLEAADQDPIAARLLTNLLNHLAEG
jgi:hypothetical protein